MSTTLMESLKKSTAPMHDSAEGSEFQSLLAKAKLPAKVYADYLSQLYLVHKVLEEELRVHSATAAVVSPAEFQEDFLRRDLEALGRSPTEAKALAATQALLNDIRTCASECPESLLGMHYVLLGSKHGGKFIAKSIHTAYQFEDGAGALYFDPYGTTFMSIWKQFKENMNKLVDADKTDAVCAAAGQMFIRITEIGNELLPQGKCAL